MSNPACDKYWQTFAVYSLDPKSTVQTLAIHYFCEACRKVHVMHKNPEGEGWHGDVSSN